MPAIGYVTRQEDGSFKGQLRALAIRADTEIMKNRTKNTESQPDYRVVTNGLRSVRRGSAPVATPARPTSR